jgi:hypothetical protein
MNRYRDHDRLHESLPAYVLGALEPDERIELEDHLDVCPVCASVYDDLAEAGTILALNVPPRTPPRDLRERLLTAAGKDTHSVDESGAFAGPEEPTTLVRLTSWTHGFQVRYAAAAAVMIAVFGVAVSIVITNGNLDERVQELESQVSTEATVVSGIAGTVMDLPADGKPTTAIETVSELALANERLQSALATSMEIQKAASQPTARTAVLQRPDGSENALGTLVAGHQSLTRGVMMIQGLDPTPPGFVYQLWMEINGIPRNLGTFQVDEMGYALVELTVPLFNAQTLAGGVTIEPGSGSRRPTGAEVLRLSAP